MSGNVSNDEKRKTTPRKALFISKILFRNTELIIQADHETS